MPTINPSLVPTISPGNLFTALTTDNTLSIRWLVVNDPVHAEVLNRPLADIALRQLILAKALDTLNASLGHQAIFPFIIQPKIAGVSSAGDVDVPLNWIWDIHLSLPKKWENLRLAKIKRISGTNTGSGTFTGKLRLIFTATQENSSVETAVLMADYVIDSTLTYQLVRALPITSLEESVAIDPGEIETVTGFLIFRTMDVTDITNENFLNVVMPPVDGTDTNNDGLFDDPAIYEIIDSVPNDPSGDFSTSAVSHGTGMLTDSAWNAIPPLDTDIQSWINSFNYPFDSTANRISTSGVVIPLGLFREFDIVAPAGDQPTGDTTGLFYPVWISRIERIGDTANQLRFFFATFNVTDIETGGSPSLTPIEFATLDLTRDMPTGEIVSILPLNNLQLQTGTEADLFNQHFGRGHVILSSIWGETSTEVDDFFDEFSLISDVPPDIEFSQSSTRVSSFGISRVPKYTPTIGQAQALIGSTARRFAPIHPSFDNRYVTEQDQGQGDKIDLESQPGILPHIAIERFGCNGSLCHRIVKLIIDSTKVPTGDNTFYEQQVRPRLRILLGRPEIFGDIWFNGTRFMIFNGDTWQSFG